MFLKQWNDLFGLTKRNARWNAFIGYQFVNVHDIVRIALDVGYEDAYRARCWALLFWPWLTMPFPQLAYPLFMDRWKQFYDLTYLEEGSIFYQFCADLILQILNQPLFDRQYLLEGYNQCIGFLYDNVDEETGARLVNAFALQNQQNRFDQYLKTLADDRWSRKFKAEIDALMMRELTVNEMAQRWYIKVTFDQIDTKRFSIAMPGLFNRRIRVITTQLSWFSQLAYHDLLSRLESITVGIYRAHVQKSHNQWWHLLKLLQAVTRDAKWEKLNPPAAYQYTDLVRWIVRIFVGIYGQNRFLDDAVMIAEINQTRKGLFQKTLSQMRKK